MMDYVKTLKQILKVENIENSYCEFFNEIEKYTTLTIIPTSNFEEIISFLAKEQPTEYQIDKKEFTTYYYLQKTIFTKDEMDNYQNKTVYIKDYDDGDFHILIKECYDDCQIWLAPIFFKEFYEYCEEVLNNIKPSPSVEEIEQILKKEEDEKKTSVSVNKFCDTVAKVLLDSMDMLNNMILSMTDLGASNDQIIKTISIILENHFNN